jgi:hypothetical protein
MRECSRWILRFAASFAIAVMVSGCVGSTAGQMALSADVYGRSTFFVERSAADKRDLAATIAEKMRERGLKATAESADGRTPQCDYVVKYTDRWFWDMRMYLADLRIEVRDAKNQSIVGFGQSSQSSLKAMGKTHEDIIEAALAELFKAR